jgi:endonuclease VIII
VEARRVLRHSERVPEGDVVLRTARRLNQALAGQVLTVSDFRWPSLATVDLTGRAVHEVVAVGKHLLIRVDGAPGGDPGDPGDSGVTVHSHLRMDGSWHLHRTGERWANPRPDHGIRLVLANEAWTAIGHRLGMLDLIATDREDAVIGHLGPDILAPGWDLDICADRVRANRDRSIGETLLDQRVMAGIGTFFMSEVCFLRGVHPWRGVHEVDDVRALVDLAHRLMTVSVDQGRQVTTGDARRGQEQWVHSRSGRPCRRCGTTIRVARLGEPPDDRVAFWCPHCQPGDVPTDSGAAQRPLGAPAQPASGRAPGPASGNPPGKASGNPLGKASGKPPGPSPPHRPRPGSNQYRRP